VIKIALIEDDTEIQEMLIEFLVDKGYQVKAYSRGGDFLLEAASGRFDAIVLDLMLPDIDGYEIARNLRENWETASIPILMLTARVTEQEVLRGFQSGADDYVRKPFSSREVLARLEALLRRSGAEDNLTIEKLRLDRSRRSAEYAGREVALTQREFDLLWALASSSGRVLSRDYLLDTVWGREVFVTPRTVDVHIRHLRKKLGSGGKLLETLRGAGYRIKLRPEKI
jgi:two-component system alkaline phosphatase synthesis response regulator PhoP